MHYPLKIIDNVYVLHKQSFSLWALEVHDYIPYVVQANIHVAVLLSILECYCKTMLLNVVTLYLPTVCPSCFLKCL